MNSEPSIFCVVRTALFVVFAGRAKAAPVTLDFEGSDSTTLTTQYTRAMFTNAIIPVEDVPLNGFAFAPHSGVNVVSDNGGPMTIDLIAPFTAAATG